MNRKRLVISLSLIILMIVIFLLITFQKSSKSHDEYKSLIFPNAEWQYSLSTSPVANIDLKEGCGTIGQGIDTLLKPDNDTLFTHILFNISDIKKLKNLELLIRYEANCVIYINHQKIAVKEYESFNMNKIISGFDSISDLRHDYLDAITFKKTFASASFNRLLKNEKNQLTIGFYNPRISGKEVRPTVLLRGIYEIKDRLKPVKKTNTVLPIIYIDTHSDTISKEDKIVASMEISGSNVESKNFSGKIKINYRGFTSLSFGKKSYTINTLDDKGKKKQKCSILGLPEEQEWVLYASLFDKTLIRNPLIFEISNKIGLYAPRTRYIELYVNNKYEGIYILMEKVKQNISRVNITPIEESDTLVPSVTGGYILQIDRTITFRTSVPLKNDRWHKTPYEIIYPKEKEIHPLQFSYIRNYIEDFEESLYYSSDIKNDTSYLQYINVQSFIDYLLLCELSKNIDALCLSTYISKDRNGKLNMGPLWDFDLTFGMSEYKGGYDYQGSVINDNPYVPFWWSKLMKNEAFRKALCKRYQELRSNAFSEDYIFSEIDKYAEELSPTLDRNFNRWKVNKGYLWPNYMNDITYSEEIEYLKFWTGMRLKWLDNYLSASK